MMLLYAMGPGRYLYNKSYRNGHGLAKELPSS